MQAQQSPALPDIISVEALLALSFVALAALALSLLARSLTRRLFRGPADGSPRPHAHATVKAVGRITLVMSFLVLAFPALDLAGVDLNVGLEQEDVTRWVARSGVRVLLLILIAYVANRFAASVIKNAEEEMGHGQSLEAHERRKRLNTVGATLRRFFSILIWSAASLMILRELDVDITPVLTGAGIIGLAVGFGAQTLVKDIISGLFLIVEDQVRLDDVAEINGVSGVVEEINLRTIVLRDLHGVVHHIASGEIRTLANKSKDYSYYVIDLSLDFDDDSDRLIEIIKGAARELMLDPAFAASILEPLEVLGLDAFKGAEVTVRCRIKTLPLKQWEVGRELRRRIKIAFHANGVQNPAPQFNVTLKQTPGQNVDARPAGPA
jgi:moderate conductance mechanosensitive channel